MKKTKILAFMSTAIVCYIFWLTLTGQLAAIFTGGVSVQVLLAGVLVSGLTSLFTSRFFIHEKPFFLFNPKRFFIWIYYNVVVFMWELLKANWDVARRALSPKCPTNPGIVKIKTELKSEYALSSLANSITLTPGTITLDIAEAQDGTYCYIHWIDASAKEVDGASDAISGTFEKWLRRIWE